MTPSTAVTADKDSYSSGKGFVYTSLRVESNGTPLLVEGRIPKWINGVLYRNGPALFEIGNQAFNHWFDGQAMIHAFHICDGNVTYSNKFLDTTNLRTHRAAGKIAMSEFGTDPCSTVFRRFKSLFQTQVEYQNANVSVRQMCGKLVALTESPLPMEFDSSLTTLGPVRWGDKLEKGMVSTAHPHLLEDGSYLSYVVQFGRKTSYILYTIPAAPAEVAIRTEVARIEVKEASYMHSFGVSRSWYVLAECPWKFSVSRMLVDRFKKFMFGSKCTVLDAFKWKPELGTVFRLISREDGRVKRIRVPPFFCYHFINCFDSDAGICVDMMTYECPGYEAMTLAKLRDGSAQQDEGFARPEVRRYILNAEAGTFDVVVLHKDTIELPVINYDACNMKPYRYVYGLRRSELVKLDVSSGETKLWCYPSGCVGEPIFSARPGATDEDDGAVLSVIFDAPSQTSFLLVLDASTFEEIGRASLTHHVPSGLHGLFVAS